MPGAAAVRAAHNKAKAQHQKAVDKAEALADEIRAARSGSGPAPTNNSSPRFAGVALAATATEAQGASRITWAAAARRALNKDDGTLVEDFEDTPTSGGASSSAGGEPAQRQPSSVSLAAVASPEKASPSDGKPAKKKPLSASGGVSPTGFFLYKRQVKDFYNNRWVQGIIAVLIIGNFIVNALEKEIDPSGRLHTGTFTVLEDMFNIIFLFELIINAYGDWFWPFLCSGWNIFDIIVVIVGVISLSWFNVDLPGPMRLLRTLRAFRVFRLFRRVKSLRKILASILSAIPGVFNAFMVVILVLSIYAILAVEFFYDFDQHPVVVGQDADGNDIVEVECYYELYFHKRATPDADWPRVSSRTARGLCTSEEYYGTFTRAWYTLFQVLTGDSWSEAVARPVLFGWDYNKLNSTGYLWTENGLANVVAAIYFISFVIVNSFVLINVVVAVLLDKMVSSDDGDEDEDDADGDVMDGVEAELEADRMAAEAAMESRTYALPGGGDDGGGGVGGGVSAEPPSQQALLEEQRALAGKVDAMLTALTAMSKALDAERNVE